MNIIVGGAWARMEGLEQGLHPCCQRLFWFAVFDLRFKTGCVGGARVVHAALQESTTSLVWGSRGSVVSIHMYSRLFDSRKPNHCRKSICLVLVFCMCCRQNVGKQCSSHADACHQPLSGWRVLNANTILPSPPQTVS